MKNKKTLLIISGTLCVLALLTIGILCDNLSNEGASRHKLGGLMNPENVLIDKPLNEEEQLAEYQSRPIYTEAIKNEIDSIILQKLSEGDFNGLDQYLEDVLKQYQTSPEADESPEGRLHALRSDIANVLGITNDNGPYLLKSFGTPEALAAAIAYLPISQKYLAFGNYNSIVVPAVSKQDGSNQRVLLAESSSMPEQLQKINDRNANQFLAIRTYTMQLFDKNYELIVLLNKNQCWEPFSLRPVDGNIKGLIDVLKAKKMADSLQGTGTSLDTIISYEEPDFVEDESSFLDPDAP